MNRRTYRPQIDGVLYHHGGKPSTFYPDLEPGNEFWNRDRVGYLFPGTNHVLYYARAQYSVLNGDSEELQIKESSCTVHRPMFMTERSGYSSRCSRYRQSARSWSR